MSRLWRSWISRSYVVVLLYLSGLGCQCANGQTLTVSAAPSTVNFTLARNGAASGNSAITITTSWLVSLPPLTITLYAFTSSTTAALTDGAGHNIPTSNVSGSANGGAAGAFTGNSSFAAGRSLTIFTQSTLASQDRATTHSDSKSIQRRLLSPRHVSRHVDDTSDADMRLCKTKE